MRYFPHLLVAASCMVPLVATGQIIDQRSHKLFNGSSNAAVTNGPMPKTVVYAADYGAVCNGSNNDYPAIHAAVNAMVAIAGGVETAGAPPKASVGVELPQGKCLISQPIVLTNYGSLQGSKNGTWLGLYGTFSRSEAMVQLTLTYDRSSYSNQTTSTINRYVKDINFICAWNTPPYDITGIAVYDQTGSSSTYPYPAGPIDWQSYQPPGVTISGNSFFSMDTAIDVADCNNCDIDNNQIFYVRRGIVEEGNTFILNTHDNYILAGSDTYSHTGGTTYGYQAPGSDLRWQCLGGKGQTCTGGTITRTAIASPQGCNFSHNQVATFDIDFSITNCQGGEIVENGFDYGGSTHPSTINATVVIGANAVWFQMAYNLIANSQCNAPIIEVGAPVGNPGDTNPYYQGLWITNNWIQTYCASGQQSGGIVFDSGTYPRRNVYITDNQFYWVGYGVIFGHPVQYSEIRGNYAVNVNYAIFTFKVAGGGNFQGSVFSHNSTPDAKRVYSNATPGNTNYVMEYNIGGSAAAPTQLTGTQIATGPGCSVSAGIGQACLVTMKLPVYFPDTSYLISGCQLIGATGSATAATVGSKSNDAFTFPEINLSSSAVSGGTFYCNVTHY
jgi:hypothetical protein